jgi:hypothetical protein
MCPPLFCYMCVLCVYFFSDCGPHRLLQVLILANYNYNVMWYTGSSSKDSSNQDQWWSDSVASVYPCPFYLVILYGLFLYLHVTRSLCQHHYGICIWSWVINIPLTPLICNEFLLSLVILNCHNFCSLVLQLFWCHNCLILTIQLKRIYGPRCALAYHPSCSGGGDQEDLGLRPAQANEPGVEVHTLIPATWEAQIGELRSRLALGRKWETLSEK